MSIFMNSPTCYEPFWPQDFKKNDVPGKHDEKIQCLAAKVVEIVNENVK